MSGGSHNYIYSKLSIECEGEMHDEEMNAMIKDLCDVLHDLEWWQSGDYSEDQYMETVSEFKKKWLKGDRTNRPEPECKNCKHYEGNCGHHHVDSLTGHINYEIPAERMYVNKFDPSCYEWKGDEDECYGLETFYITKEEIDALLSGKKLYSTVNCDEYAITIEMEDEK